MESIPRGVSADLSGFLAIKNLAEKKNRGASDDFHTIGGFVFGLCGRLPRIGEQIRLHDLRLRVLEMEYRKVTRL